jgi:hypothetical protein
VSSSKTKKTKKKKVKVVPFLMGRTPRPFSRWQLTLGVTYEKTDHGPYPPQKKTNFLVGWNSLPFAMFLYRVRVCAHMMDDFVEYSMA